jgi:signal peptidase II
MGDRPLTETPVVLRRPSAWRWLILPVLALLILALDQGTKYLIVQRIPPYQAWMPVPALAHLFNLTFITNTGAAFGLFQDRSLVFVVVAVVISIGIVLYLRQIPHEEWLMRVALSMQLGGALGNLLDRIRLGYVVDFVDFHMWPVFNFADTFIVVGVGLLAYCLLVRPAPAQPIEKPTTETQSAQRSDP